MTGLMRLIVVATLCADGATTAALWRGGAASADTLAAPTPAGSRVVATVARDGLFHLDGASDQKPVDFVVDTGASVTVVSVATARLLGGAPMRRRERDATIETAGGPTTMTWWHLPDLAVAGRRLGAIDVAVVDRGPALLGQDALSRLGAITFNRGQMVVR